VRAAVGAAVRATVGTAVSAALRAGHVVVHGFSAQVDVAGCRTTASRRCLPPSSSSDTCPGHQPRPAATSAGHGANTTRRRGAHCAGGAGNVQPRDRTPVR
jgi:hypothetical protein